MLERPDDSLDPSLETDALDEDALDEDAAARELLSRFELEAPSARADESILSLARSRRIESAAPFARGADPARARTRSLSILLGIAAVLVVGVRLFGPREPVVPSAASVPSVPSVPSASSPGEAAIGPAASRAMRRDDEAVAPLRVETIAGLGQIVNDLARLRGALEGQLALAAADGLHLETREEIERRIRRCLVDIERADARCERLVSGVR